MLFVAGSFGDRVAAVAGVVSVLAGARRNRVQSNQREARGRMVELGGKPAVGAVAALARLLGKFGDRGMGWVSRAVEVFLMAAEALCRHGGERCQRATFMAIVAGRGGVRAGQREAVHMHVDLRDVHLPAPDGVTVFAGARQFAAVNVGVAVGTLIADIGEHHLGMAVRACHPLVQAAERKLGLVVIELRHRADLLPSVHGVAVLAGDVQISVRAARLRVRLRGVPAPGGRR